MKRRVVLWTASAAVLWSAGCLGGRGGGFADTPETGDETPAVEDAVLGLRDTLEGRGIEVLSVAAEESRIELTMQTSGDLDDDIRRTAGAYATAATTLDRDLSVRVEDRGLSEARFEIRHEWARQFADDRLGDREYIDRINDTRSTSQ
jgi:hypothetical protein